MCRVPSPCQVHHLGHHASYTSQLNAVLEKMRWDPELKHLAKMGVDELLHNLGSVPEGEAEGWEPGEKEGETDGGRDGEG